MSGARPIILVALLWTRPICPWLMSSHKLEIVIESDFLTTQVHPFYSIYPTPFRSDRADEGATRSTGPREVPGPVGTHGGSGLRSPLCPESIYLNRHDARPARLEANARDFEWNADIFSCQEPVRFKCH
jgi:hypothetical protein